MEKNMMQIRYEKLQKLLEEKKLDAVLVSDGYNMRYLSGFTGATGYLLVTKQSKTLFTEISVPFLTETVLSLRTLSAQFLQTET
jgi:Xaa-Pro aminopeptidase